MPSFETAKAVSYPYCITLVFVWGVSIQFIYKTSCELGVCLTTLGSHSSLFKDF